MSKLIPFLLFFLFYAIWIPVHGQNVKIGPNVRLDLYLLIGQSNMAGLGTIEAQDTITDPGGDDSSLPTFGS